MCLRLSACLLLLAGTGGTPSESHQAPDLFYLYKTVDGGNSYPAVRSPVSLAVGDFNHDRKADLAVALRNDKLLVLLGRGDGSFLQKAVYEYGDTPTSVVAADVNEDGLPDLVVTHGGKMSSSVVVFLGNGDGTFHSPVAYKTGHSPLNVSVLVLKGARHLDLLVVNGERDG